MLRAITLVALLASAIVPYSHLLANAGAKQPLSGSPSDSERELARALELHQRAVQLHQSGDSSSALPLFAEALRVLSAVLGIRHPDTLACYSNYASALLALGRAGEAEPILAEILQLRREVQGERHPDTISSLNNYASVLESLGRLQRAESLFSEALLSSLQTFGERDPGTLVQLNNNARILLRLGRLEDAERLAAQALQLRGEVLGVDDPATLNSMNLYASVLFGLGQVDEALLVSAEALRMHRAVLGNRHPNTLATLNNYAGQLGRTGRHREAAPLLAELVEVTRRSFGERHPYTLTSLNNYAGVLLDLEIFDRAVVHFAEAFRLRRGVLGHRHPDTLASMAGYGTALMSLDRLDEAEPILAEALRFRREVLGERHPDTLISLNNYAHALKTNGRTYKAEPFFALALRLSRETLGANHPQSIVSLNNYAQALLRNGRPREALTFSRELTMTKRARALELAEDRLRGGQQLLRELGTRQASERFHIDVLWANFSFDPTTHATLPEEALTALQFASAGSTSGAVAEAAASRFAADVGLQRVVQERKALLWRWVALEKTLVEAQAGGPESAERRTAVRELLRVVEERIEVLDAQLEAEAPQYFAIRNPLAVDLDNLRAVLGEDEAALFLVPTDRGTHAMAVTREDIRWERAEIDSGALGERVAAFREGLEVEGEFLPLFDLNEAHALYSELVAPVEEALRGKARVYVIADGALSRVPLGTLVVTEPPENADPDSPEVLRETDWLADRYALVQLPSLQSLVYIRTYGMDGGMGDASPFAGFGAPVLDGKARTRGARSATLAAVDASGLVGSAHSASGAPLMDPSTLRELAALPGTRSELRQVQTALGAEEDALFLAERMTEPAIRNADLSQTRILHLATHGFTSEEAGTLAEPGLIFTPPTEAQADNDGYLAASEVVGLDLTSAEWVILSACNTAAPSGSAEQTGLSGLAQAFFYSGAESLLVSHWPVFDDIAPLLIVEVLRLSQQGMPRAEALQQAMLTVRNDPSLDAAHPAVWAPFTLAGEGR